jgi:hypothetical protein
MIKLITTLLKLIIFNISWMFNSLLRNILCLPLVDMVMAQVADVAPPGYRAHLLADPEGTLRVRGGVTLGLQVLGEGLRWLLSGFGKIGC